MGLLDRRDRTVHIDKDLHPKKVVFNRCQDEAGRDRLSFRRSAASKAYTRRFGPLSVPAVCGPENFFFQNRPAGKFTAPTPCTLRDLNHEKVAAVVEAFDSSYEV